MSYIVPRARTNAGQVMIALRAGPLELPQLAERLGDSVAEHGIRDARQQGYVASLKEGNTTFYHLTVSGRADCPSRRDLRDWMPGCLRPNATPA